MTISTEKKNTPGKVTGGAKFFAAYMRREGPKAPGSKPIPIGKKGCFKNLKFLCTGVLDSLNRDEFKRIVEQYEGSLLSAVSKNLNFLVVGNDAGHAKLEKARELKIKQLNEDEFLKLICIKSGINNPTYEGDDAPPMDLDNGEVANDENEPINSSSSNKLKKLKVVEDDDDEDAPVAKLVKKEESKTPEKKAKTKSSPSPSKLKSEKVTPIKSQQMAAKSLEPVIKPEIKTQETAAVKKEDSKVETELWVDKYKPKSMAKIIGQNTDTSNAAKLLKWLKNWKKHHASGAAAPAKKPWGSGNDDGSSFKAALLSGPPGIGKTTTAQLVCKEAGFTFIEFNASDSRSKKLLDVKLGESVDNGSLDNYFKKPSAPAQPTHSDNHCVIMDEVDGMAGNEDRGGIAELISTIKHSRIPIICICNDRQHPKIRSLVNYCFDLRFYKPGLAQIRSALLSICFKEGVKIPNEVLDQIIVGANYDIRQCLNNLSMWTSNCKTIGKENTNDIEKAVKDIKKNPFEAVKQVFQADPNKPKTLSEKMELFFADYSLMPLLVHENYLHVVPGNLAGNLKQRQLTHLSMMSDSMEGICEGDRIGRMLRTTNNWQLLTPQGIFSCVVPGEKLSGTLNQMVGFPSWFGKNSKQGRVDRILQELQKHMRIHISANKIGVGMDYLSVLKTLLTKPLIKKGADGIQMVIDLMNEYSITREDFDTICELATWPGQKDPTTLIDSKVKASFTRQYNKESHKNPFTLVNIKKLKGTKLNEDYGENGDEEEEDDENEDDVTTDAMIKVKEKKTTKASTSKAAATGGVKRAATKASDDVEPKPTASKKKKT